MGAKWLGYAAKARILWNLGVYGDCAVGRTGVFQLLQLFSGRLVWLPILSATGRTLLHIGVGERFGKVKDGPAALEGSPWCWAGAVHPRHSRSSPPTALVRRALEIRRPPAALLTFGSEYFFQRVDSPGDRESVLSRRGRGRDLIHYRRGSAPTTPKGGYFNQISPKKPISRWLGAWEPCCAFQQEPISADSKSITGGQLQLAIHADGQLVPV